METKRVNPCRPGYGASCALCCGSHNYRMSPEALATFFRHESMAGNEKWSAGSVASPTEKLYSDAIQCPHIGYDTADPDLLCCRVYRDQHDNRELEHFFHSTCKIFYCAAWHVLSDEQVLFAAQLMGDWDYYSLLVNDIATVIKAITRYAKAENVPPDELDSMKQYLQEKLRGSSSP
jgi:hypothetical protein